VYNVDNAVDEATKEVDSYVETIKKKAEIGGRYMTLGDLMDKMAEEKVAEKEAEMRIIIEEKEQALAEKDAEIDRLWKMLAQTKYSD